MEKIANSIQNKECVQASNLTFYCGVLYGKNVVIVQSGIGKVNAALCAQLLIIKFGVTKVINTGIAGALGQGLGVFDFVVSTAAVYHDFDTTAFGYKKGQVPGLEEKFTADDTLANLAVKAFEQTEFAGQHKIVKGLIASGDQFISDSKAKKSIKADFTPACVEMEGAAIAHACALNKVPFVIVRCLSDMADESVEKTYSFNEDVCAATSACLVKKMLEIGE